MRPFLPDPPDPEQWFPKTDISLARMAFFESTCHANENRTDLQDKIEEHIPSTVGSPARFWSAPVLWRFGDGREPTKSATGLQGWRTPRRCRAIHRFMVPIHAHKREEDFL